MLALFAAPMCLVTMHAQAAPKTDVVVFTNGDRLTGEIKALDRGQLRFKTEATDTISITWDRVARIETRQYLQVELMSGLRYFGQSPASERDGVIRVAADDDEAGREIPIADIIRIDPIDQGSLLDRLDGYVTGGYDYTRATRLTQFTFTGGLSSRDEYREWSLDGAATVTTQDDRDDSQRYDVTLTRRRFLEDRQFWQALLGIEGNDELGLDARGTLGAAYGVFLAQTAKSEWSVLAGLAVIREDFTSQPTESSVEAVFGTEYSLFRYHTPEASVDASLYLLPSLTESGRYRSEGKLRSRYEIVEDLFFEISLFGSYDSDPDKEADTHYDYGVTTSLGYSF